MRQSLCTLTIVALLLASTTVVLSVGACQSATASAASGQSTATASGTYSTDRAQARLRDLARQMEGYLADLPVDSTQIPRAVAEDGSLLAVKSRDWTSGFFPGTLWILSDATDSPTLEQAARTWTEFIKKEQFDDHTHDLGFKIYNSLGQGYRLADEREYEDEIVQASRTLIERFRPEVGTIKSWDWGAKRGWTHPTIIDNMMNLEMLFAATAITGDSTFYRVADTHAATTLANHFRDDHSSYHVIDYDTLTGAVRKRETHQGMSDESAWSRGQAWGLYGFANTYGQTRDPRYLQAAKDIAEYFIEHPNMPADGIPYYDFDAPAGDATPRDVSAATVAASGLLELIRYDPDNAEAYLAYVDRVLATLETPAYQTDKAPFFLAHSTGSVPGKFEVDVPISYGDYYYVETLQRRAAL